MYDVNRRLLSSILDMGLIYSRIVTYTSVRPAVEEMYTHITTVKDSLYKNQANVSAILADLQVISYDEVKEIVSPSYDQLKLATVTCLDHNVLKSDLGRCRVLSQVYDIVREMADQTIVRSVYSLRN